MSCKINWLFCLLTFVPLFASNYCIAAPDARFVCGGSIEKVVWGLWDQNIQEFIKQKQIRDRLFKQGDVYALYDFQVHTHNIVSMARRCNRLSRLMEVARLVRTVYGALESGTPSSPGRRWVCRDGTICNDKNRLLNQEVMLDSIQFLVFASSVANALASSDTPFGDEEKIFIGDTVQIAVEHLLHWDDDAALLALRRATTSTPLDVKNGTSAHFFTDKPL